MKRPARRLRKHAFSLVEVIVSLGIIATTMVLLIPLLAIGVQSNQSTLEETQAANLSTLIIADVVGSNQNTAGTTPLFGLRDPNTLRGLVTAGGPALAAEIMYFSEAYQASASLTADSRYRVQIIYSQPLAFTGAPLEANLAITWPARITNPSAPGGVPAAGQFATFFTIPDPDVFEN